MSRYARMNVFGDRGSQAASVWDWLTLNYDLLTTRVPCIILRESHPLDARSRRTSDNAARQLSHDAQRVRAFYEGLTDPDELSPRVRMGLRLYVHTAVPTLKAAAKAVGLHPGYLKKVARTKAGKAFMKTAHDYINDTALQTNQLIEKLGRRAVEVIGTTMEDASSEALRLKAAIDLADRSPETSKIHKHQVEGLLLSGEDARSIAESMVAAAAVRQANMNLRTENFDKVKLDGEDGTEPIAIPALTLEK